MADPLGLSRRILLYAYFIFTPALGSAILFTVPTQIHSLHYTDALFMCFSAMTGTGLSVIGLSTLNTFQQGTLFTLLILGHSFPIFGITTLLRAWAFRKALRDDSNNKRDERKVAWISTLQIEEKQIAGYEEGAPTATFMNKETPGTTGIEAQASLSTSCHSEGSWNDYSIVLVTDSRHLDQSRPDTQSSNFIDEKGIDNHEVLINCNEPSMIEYMALSLIGVLVILYFVSFLLLGILSIGLWSTFIRPDIPQEDGASPFWAGAFLATSAFCNNGMSLIDANMGPYQKESFPLIACGILILAGNTLFPCLIRFFIWFLRAVLPSKPAWQLWRGAFDFTLAQSQRLCTYIYPSWHTWFLLGTVLALNTIMWAAFELSAIHNEEIGSLPTMFQVLDGLFQALAVRGGGFSVVAFDRLPQGLLILYVLMMYLSAFPVSAAINSTSVANIRPTEPPRQAFNRSSLSVFSCGRFIYQQLGNQFSHDVWLLSIVILLITIIESENFKAEPLAFSTFKIIFEVVSAYSCVGVSIGYPGQSYAFCGAWHTLSKLLLIAVALQGRHRDLSVGIDDPILFPKPRLVKEELINVNRLPVYCA